ncbi:MAG: Galactose/methyl galactoside import ATP-binding protein MglA [candidate division WS2 bacterium]|uniref:Galactose/methyl galactoside import ATP-binding protein MglA n=1 Tax=Psychracetigena formicireducens TaxID=2986056 RepID=A0A9E2BIE8_PSYF1|nr:Galactose/methyl galactoside import ATP-binding protein MglA [Candidatus Psychracetigena formicireducens]MBT9146176.1 Galactose/methyl galactoside import ATP-binding protein MglA [Candidatus Psychracetigena formicireducens]
MFELKSIYKDFFGVQALKNVTLTLQEGEILGLVGENGAGKSTLMNILFGMPIIHETGGYQGEILFDGKPVIIKSAKEAMDLGIGMIHQEFMLIPGFSVAENIKLNREPTKSNIFSRFINQKLETLDMVTIRKDSKNVLQEIGLGIDELLPIIGLPVRV